MAKIYFSMSGEGLGHATRVGSLVEALRTEGHEMVLFAPGNAYSLLSRSYRASDEVRVIRIPGLRFAYTRGDRLDLGGTIGNFLHYAGGLPRLVKRLEEALHRDRPDLVITDFEPALPRAARRSGVPFISVNHQHFLVVNDLSALPHRLRRHARYMGLVVRHFYSGQERTVVSQFYFPPIKPRYRREVIQAGVLLRPQLLRAVPTDEGFLLAYCHRTFSTRVLSALMGCGFRVRSYGQERDGRLGNIEFRKIAGQSFVEDLATCSAVVTTAGNQLVGEAIFLRKPVLALPEPNNMEQYINAYYLEESGCGEWAEMSEITARRIRAFVEKWRHFTPRVGSERLNGNAAALTAIEQVLAG